jgi:glutamine amidotransferase
VEAKFWLLDAPDALVKQSHKNPDGTGLGFFDARGAPVLDKQPLAAFDDPAFAREAKKIESSQFVSHIRSATTGAKTPENCHPFAMDGRIFAHNGVIGDLDKLSAYLGDDLALVRGQTDSEHYFALITKEIRAQKGDVLAGIRAAVGWVADNLPVISMNFILATPHEMWALRYPEADRLFVLQRAPGGPKGRELHYVSSHGLRVHSAHLAEKPAVVVASEPLDDNPAWHLFRSGELIHVAKDLTVSSQILVDKPPAHTLILDKFAGQDNVKAPEEPARAAKQKPRDLRPH